MTDAEHALAVQREGPFLARFATEASHRAARRQELESVVAGLRPMVERLALLLKDRREIDKEKEFYVGKPLPPQLAVRDDANAAQLQGLSPAFRRIEDSIRDHEARHRCERDSFGPLWQDAAPGASACRRPACLAG